MALRHSVDPSAARWIAASGTPWPRLVLFGPAGFDAYARLRYIPDPTARARSEADVEVPEDHPRDLVQARRALAVLARFTTTPERCYFCAWDGYSDLPLPPSATLIDLPHRRYALLEGAASDLDGWADAVGVPDTPWPPALAWPADRRWFFASDVDPHWAGIGASAEAVDALLREPGLDVVRARPEEAQPEYR